MRARLEHAPELLDEAVHDTAELQQSLEQVAQVNRLLGGRRAVWIPLRRLLDERREYATAPLRILDIGTGSADIPLHIAQQAARRGAAVEVTATDAHAQMREIARARTVDCPAITVDHADALKLSYDDASFDVVLLSLVLHHFEAADQLTALREAARVARRAVIVNELERNRANYYGARALAATWWRGNRLTRHDGPLSVLRAFTRSELQSLAHAAGLRVERLDRRYCFRLVLMAATQPRGAG
jgi:ubiquinone/menaquinone biosynthesis C-methylase UbiE